MFARTIRCSLVITAISVLVFPTVVLAEEESRTITSSNRNTEQTSTATVYSNRVGAESIDSSRPFVATEDLVKGCDVDGDGVADGERWELYIADDTEKIIVNYDVSAVGEPEKLRPVRTTGSGNVVGAIGDLQMRPVTPPSSTGAGSEDLNIGSLYGADVFRVPSDPWEDSNGDVKPWKRLLSETGRWFTCGDNITVFPENGEVDVEALVSRAVADVSPGEPEFTIFPYHEEQESYVNIDTVFGVADTYWQTRSASASAGRVTTTVTLVPVRSVWNTDQPNKPPVACAQGEIGFVGDNKTPESFPCTYRYTRSSPVDEPYTVTADVEFEVQVTSNVGDLGVFPDLVLSGSQPLHVREIQAVITDKRIGR